MDTERGGKSMRKTIIIQSTFAVIFLLFFVVGSEARNMWKSKNYDGVIYKAESGNYTCYHPGKKKIKKDSLICKPLNIYKNGRFTKKQAMMKLSRKGQVGIYIRNNQTGVMELADAYNITLNETSTYFATYGQW